MAGRSCVEDFEVKRANIKYHNIEAEFFEKVHPEGSSIYERAKVSKSITFITKNSWVKDLCVDVGCGTGFVTGFELTHYGMVVATDISRKMLKSARKRFEDIGSLNFLACDAEFLPFRNDVADLVSISSVLHHLPRPFKSIAEISRILKKGGFVYITREPSFQRLRRFFDFFDHLVIQKLLRLARFMNPEAENVDLGIRINGLDYAKVDVHYPTGFHVVQLSNVLFSYGFDVVSAYSYHWIYPDSNRGWLQILLTKSNFLIEKFPLSNRLGRYVSITARKSA